MKRTFFGFVGRNQENTLNNRTQFHLKTSFSTFCLFNRWKHLRLFATKEIRSAGKLEIKISSIFHFASASIDLFPVALRRVVLFYVSQRRHRKKSHKNHFFKSNEISERWKNVIGKKGSNHNIFVGNWLVVKHQCTFLLRHEFCQVCDGLDKHGSSSKEFPIFFSIQHDFSLRIHLNFSILGDSGVLDVWLTWVFGDPRNCETCDIVFSLPFDRRSRITVSIIQSNSFIDNPKKSTTFLEGKIYFLYLSFHSIFFLSLFTLSFD